MTGAARRPSAGSDWPAPRSGTGLESGVVRVSTDRVVHSAHHDQIEDRVRHRARVDHRATCAQTIADAKK